MSEACNENRSNNNNRIAKNEIKFLSKLDIRFLILILQYVSQPLFLYRWYTNYNQKRSTQHTSAFLLLETLKEERTKVSVRKNWPNMRGEEVTAPRKKEKKNIYARELELQPWKWLAKVIIERILNVRSLVLSERVCFFFQMLHYSNPIGQ